MRTRVNMDYPPFEFLTLSVRRREWYYDGDLGRHTSRPMAPHTESFAIGSPISSDYSYMEDEPGPKSNVPKYVHHRQMRGKRSDGKTVTTSYLPDGTPGHVYDIPGISSSINDMGFLTPPDSNYLAGVSLAAYNSFMDQIPEQSSLPNFLLEIGDVKSLIPTIEQWRRLDYWLNHLHGDFAHRRKTVGDVLRFARNGFLGYNFGVKPLVSDLQKFGKVVQVVRKQIDYLRSVQGRRRRVHYNHKYSYSSALLGKTFSNTQTDWRVIRHCKSLDVHVHVMAEVTSELEGLDRAETEIVGLLNALGFHNAPKVAWNAIPFSFVMEYFAKVGPFIDRLEAQPFQGKWDVFNVQHSVAIKGVVETSLYLPGVLGRFGQSDPLFMMNTAIKSYTRNRGFPGGFSSIHITSPTDQQKLLLSALLDQKVRK